MPNGTAHKLILTRAWIISYFIIVLLLVLYLKWSFVGGWLTEKNLESACSDGTSPSATCLVRMRAMGNFWSAQGNIDRAERWYLIAANNGDEIAMFHLGWLYHLRAVGTTRSWIGDSIEPKRIFAAKMALASKWYERSSEKGFAPAMNNLGQLYLHGNGKVQDKVEAFKWTLAAAKAGNPVAAWNLALWGGGTPMMSPEEAKEWLVWDSTKVDPRDLLFPILDRTMLFGSELPQREKFAVRAAARQGTPVKLELTPLKPYPRLPVFHHVDEDEKNEKEQTQ